MKVSTVLVLAMAGIVVTTLVLSYLKMPQEEDALFRSFHGDAPLGSSVPPVAPAETPLPRGPSRAEDTLLSSGEPSMTGTASGTGVTGASGGAGAAFPGVRRLPLWSPGYSPVAGSPGLGPSGSGPGAYPVLPPEIRNVETLQTSQTSETLEKASGASPGGSATLDGTVDGGEAGRPRAGEPPSPYVYMVQVRAKESMEGAQRILEYLSLFGFEESLIDRDPRGDRNAAGEKLYTVFVGRYFQKAEADRECQRLKKETRLKPFKNREDAFQDCLVITRTR